MNERLKRDLIKSPAEPSVNIISALIKYGYVYFQHALGVKLTQIQCPVSLESLLVCHAPYRSVWSVHWPLLWANIVFPHMDVHFKIKTKRINQKKKEKEKQSNTSYLVECALISLVVMLHPADSFHFSTAETVTAAVATPALEKRDLQTLDFR